MDMASVVYRKQDKIDFKATRQKHEEPIYVNTQDESTADPNEIYYVLSDVDKEPIQEKPSKTCIQPVWQKLKENAVLILYVIQGLTLAALTVVSITLFLTGNDQLTNLQQKNDLSKTVNGGWTMWAEWGQCSSTCGVGQQVRNRTCSDPVPKFGGTHCEGESSEYRICSATSCTALNGGWATWAAWGQCSSTCGVGQQLRNRLCSNPEPKFGGKHCEGESWEYRICSAVNCTALNGGWTVWTEWGQCSSTCGVGQERRNRMCSNPKPKFGGEHCDGESSEYRICSATNCTALIGGWSEWAPWDECSTTCGSGLQRRERTCSNPAPIFGGKHCAGEPSEYQICSVSKCIDAVGFTAYNAIAVYDKGEYRLYFSNSIYVSDDSFNMTSGLFTCKIPGLYIFTATIVKSSGYSSSFSCYVKVNGVLTIQIYSYGYTYSYPFASKTVVVKLDRDDTVYLGSCGGTSYMYASFTSFAGVLVAADHD